MNRIFIICVSLVTVAENKLAENLTLEVGDSIWRENSVRSNMQTETRVSSYSCDVDFEKYLDLIAIII